MTTRADEPSLGNGAFDLEKQPREMDSIDTASRNGDRGRTTKEEIETGDGSSSEENGDDDEEPTVLDRVLSRVTSRSSVGPGPPPDGGWRAWGVCFAAHLVIMNTWGWINSFGTFQTYYTDLLGRPSSDISWIGSITVFLLFFIGTLTGRLVDAGYFRAVFLFGTVLQLVGLFTISVSHTYTHFLLAQGICMGVAAGFIFCPVLATTSTYFHKRKALALGIAACGSSTGGLIFPGMVRELLPRVGFAWTIRAIGFIQLGTFIVAHVLIKPRIRPRRTGALVDFAAFMELEYTFYAAGSFFCFWGIYFAFYYLAAFSRTAIDHPLSYSGSLDLLLVLNGVGFVGRIIPNYIADRVGAVNLFVPIALTASICIFSWMAVKTTTDLYIWAVCYGLLGAGIQSLFPAGLSFLTTDLTKTGVRMGMIFTIVSFATLTGPPIAGAIIDSGAGYKGAQAFAGCVVGVGGGFLFAVKVVKMRKTGAGWLERV